MAVFFLCYLFIVGRATYGDISAELTLRKFDLNGDGNFSDNEITTEQKIAMKNVIADNARNFSFITGLIFSGIIAFFFYNWKNN